MQNTSMFLIDDQTGERVLNQYLKATIQPDPYPEKPSRIFDSIGRLVTFDKNKRYHLSGDVSYCSDDFDMWLEEFQQQTEDSCYISSYEGVKFAIVFDAAFKREFWGKQAETMNDQQWQSAMEPIAKQWQAYWQGECYQWILTDLAGDVVDSCGGFYGYEDCLSAVIGEGYGKFLVK